MAQYNADRHPDSYPKAFHEALQKALQGGYGVEHRTFYKTFPRGKGGKVSTYLSSFKASLRRFPLHPLFGALDTVVTRIAVHHRLEGVEVSILSWKKSRTIELVKFVITE